VVRATVEAVARPRYGVMNCHGRGMVRVVDDHRGWMVVDGGATSVADCRWKHTFEGEGWAGLAD
jgi:hypothetical protein